LGQQETKYVALFSIKSKYMALCKATIEVIWLHALLHELGIPQPSLINIYVNNKSAIPFTKHPKFHA
jgi:hypothetical protein